MNCVKCGDTIYFQNSHFPSRGVVKLKCNHSLHTLCFGVALKACSQIDKTKKFTCLASDCNTETSIELIKKNLPLSNSLIDSPGLFATVYLKPYFPTSSELETYLSKSMYRNVFFYEEDNINLKAEDAFAPLVEDILKSP